MLFDQGVRRVFVTGGAGFIGSHVLDMLLAEGRGVTVYDNLSSGQRKWIEQHEGKTQFRFVHADLLDSDRLRKEIAGHDVVWHLAANTDIPGGFTKTDLDLKNCILATYNVLEAMHITDVRQMLFSSTGAVYGDLCRTDFATEAAGPLLPVSLYAAGKLGSEALISAYCSLFGLHAWMFRFGNVVGGRMGHGVIYDFVQKLKQSPRELEILGDGRQEKNYFLVEDCIAGMAHAYRTAPMTDEKPADIFNLGSDSVTGVKEIARIVIEEMGLENVHIRYSGGERGWPGDQPQVHITSGKMRNLGWHPVKSSDEAVRIATKRLLHGL